MKTAFSYSHSCIFINDINLRRYSHGVPKSLEALSVLSVLGLDDFYEIDVDRGAAILLTKDMVDYVRLTIPEVVGTFDNSYDFILRLYNVTYFNYKELESRLS